MSIAQLILAGNLQEAKKEIRKDLYAKSRFVIECAKTEAVVHSARLNEMHDLPDNSNYPLTGHQVERLLWQWEYRDEDTFDTVSTSQERSEEGIKKARWYPPEQKSDFIPDAKEWPNMNDRPAKLMPYDYYWTVTKPGDQDGETAGEIGDDAVDTKAANWSGAENGFFKESCEEDCGMDDVHGAIQDAIHKAKPIDLHMADGNLVHVDAQNLSKLVTKHGIEGIAKSMENIHHFNELVKETFPKENPPAGHKEHN